MRFLSLYFLLLFSGSFATCIKSWIKALIVKAQDLVKIAPMTTALIAIFVGLFTWQVLSGVDISEPSTQDLLSWGANALPLTLAEQPWRLVSSAFLHIGLMHLLFNTFAMYFFGQVAEPLFDRWRFLTIFLLSAIGGNLLNNYYTWQTLLNHHGQISLSAGASGGIMGLGSALLAAAFFRLSVNGLRLNFRSLLIIMAINLVYGFAIQGIDNSAHIGGALVGAILSLGIVFPYLLPNRLLSASWVSHLATLIFWFIALGLMMVFFGVWWSLHQQLIQSGFLLG